MAIARRLAGETARRLCATRRRWRHRPRRATAASISRPRMPWRRELSGAGVGGRTPAGRPQGRLRQQGGVARAQARDAGLGAHVRRHRAHSPTATSAELVGRAAWSRRRSSPRSSSALKAPLPAAPPMPAACSTRSSGWRSASRSSTACSPTGQFQPADFVAVLRAARGAGRRRRRWRVTSANRAALAEALAAFTVTLLEKNGAVVAEGGGKNVAPQPGPVPGRAGLGARAPTACRPLAAGRAHQLRHAHRVAADRRGRDLDGARRRPGPARADAAHVLGAWALRAWGLRPLEVLGPEGLRSREQ